MQKREKVPATSGQIGEIAGALIGEMKFSKSEADAIIGNLGAFRKDVRKFYARYKTQVEGKMVLVPDLIRWEGVYEKLFGHKPDLSQIHVPERLERFGPMRLVVVAREILDWTNNCPIQGTQDTLKKLFQAWQYTDNLDRSIMKNDRDPKNGSYAIWVRDVCEADEENANKSANDLTEENHLGITLLERQLLEADYFLEHGEHLDQKNVTLCSGSRYRDGYVPDALWDDSLFLIYWSDPALRYPGLRSRSVWT